MINVGTKSLTLEFDGTLLLPVTATVSVAEVPSVNGTHVVGINFSSVVNDGVGVQTSVNGVDWVPVSGVVYLTYTEANETYTVRFSPVVRAKTYTCPYTVIPTYAPDWACLRGNIIISSTYV